MVNCDVVHVGYEAYSDPVRKLLRSPNCNVSKWLWDRLDNFRCYIVALCDRHQ